MNSVIIFDFSGTLVRMRPARLLVSRNELTRLMVSNRLCIVTGGRKTEVVNILEKLKIKSLFELIITKDDFPYLKPDKRIFEIVYRKFGNSKYIFVGDSKSDRLFAENCRIQFVSVLEINYKVSRIPDKMTN